MYAYARPLSLLPKEAWWVSGNTNGDTKRSQPRRAHARLIPRADKRRSAPRPFKTYPPERRRIVEAERPAVMERIKEWDIQMESDGLFPTPDPPGYQRYIPRLLSGPTWSAPTSYYYECQTAHHPSAAEEEWSTTVPPPTGDMCDEDPDAPQPNWPTPLRSVRNRIPWRASPWKPNASKK